MNRSFCLRATLILSPLLIANAAMADESVRNVSVASGQSVKATGQLALAGIKVVAGTVAAPFVILGGGVESTGRAFKDSGRAVWDDANTPLEVSDTTVVAQAPPAVPYVAPANTSTTPPAPERNPKP